MNKNGKHTSSCKANRMFNRGLGKFYEKKVEEGTYKDGKLDGLRTHWDENGLKACEYNYKDGLPNGKSFRWYENGVILEETTWKNNLLDGKSIDRYENGQKSYEVTYKDGELISEKCWDGDGNERDCS